MTGAIRLAHFIEARARETYPEIQIPNGAHDQINEKMMPKVAALLPQGATVLDVGAGYGTSLEFFTKAGFNVIGIDVNAENIAACKAKGFTVLECEQNDLGRWYQDFDCVWARHVLEHSIAPYFTLCEFARVLKPGGILYAEMPQPDGPCCHENNVNHYSVLGMRMWVDLIVRAGFGILEHLTFQFTTSLGEDRYFSFTCKKLCQPDQNQN